jgi:magnesium transporter
MTPLQNLDTILDRVRAYLADGDVESAAAAIAALRPAIAADVVSALHPADGADVLEELEPHERVEVVEELDPKIGAEVIIELDETERTDVTNRLDAESLSDFLDEMAPDDAADVLQDLEGAKAEAALAEMDEADEVRELLTHPEESAGGLMVPHAITFRGSMTAAQAIELLRRSAPDEETAYYIFVTDDAERLIGVVSLRSLVVAKPDARLETFMHRDLVTADVGTDQEECARILAKYDLLALPIVDDDQRLVGIVTADDVIDVLEEEATEDIYHLANVSAEEDVYASPLKTSRRRLMWLMINLPTAMLAAWVVSFFEGTIAQVAILAVFAPIITGQGGNAGIQTLTVIVRSMALGQLGVSEGWEALRREAIVGLLNGLAFGLVVGAIAYVWRGQPLLGLIAALAMFVNMLVAAAAGTLVPLFLKACRADPALASGVIVTTVTDVTGAATFYGLATLMIAYLLGT